MNSRRNSRETFCHTPKIPGLMYNCIVSCGCNWGILTMSLNNTLKLASKFLRREVCADNIGRTKAYGKWAFLTTEGAGAYNESIQCSKPADSKEFQSDCFLSWSFYHKETSPCTVSIWGFNHTEGNQLVHVTITTATCLQLVQHFLIPSYHHDWADLHLSLFCKDNTDEDSAERMRCGMRL